MAYFGQEPRLVFVGPKVAVLKPAYKLIHVRCENQDGFTKFRHTLGAFNPFHGQAFLA
jgi:hypothetical protein